jgi:hypothetical protein
MARKAQILRLLAVKPRTNAELQELCVDHGGSIARTMSQLIYAGKARIIAGGGRGHPCTYARTDHAS